MTARETSAACAASWSSCCATAFTSAALLLACGSSTHLPPPADLDPAYADAGPPIILHDPWPQTGPFYCHAVTATNGERAAMCSRTEPGCASWRASDQRKGFDVGPCTEELEATCVIDRQRELCFRTPAQCRQVREAMGAAAPCKTVRAVWEPK